MAGWKVEKKEGQIELPKAWMRAVGLESQMAVLSAVTMAVGMENVLVELMESRWAATTAELTEVLKALRMANESAIG